MNVWDEKRGSWLVLWRGGGFAAILAYGVIAGWGGGMAALGPAGLAAVFAVWFALGMWPPLERRIGTAHLVSIAYFGVGWVLWVGLVGYHPFAYLLLAFLYGQINIVYAPPLSYPLNGLLTLIVLFRMTILDSLPLGGVLITVGLWSIVGLSIGLFMYRVIGQSQERADLIQALEAAREDLARSERAAGLQAGIIEERQRLANEIHDTLAQGFTSVIMHLEAMRDALDAPPPRVLDHLDAAQQAARSSLSEARRFVWALRPDILEQKALGDGLRQLVNEWAAAEKVAAVLHITGTPVTLRPECDVVLLRVLQEALANVARHAAATQVTITLSYLPGVVVLDVQDDGRGFGASAGPTLHGGFGLIGMRERVERLGGSFLIEGVPGQGTTLLIELPLTAQGERSVLHAID